MLNAYWEKQQKDTLALMQPFVEYAIGATSRKGKPINIETVHKKIESEFGYDEIPLPVIQKIMERMSGHLLSRRDGKFYLREEMTAKLEAFEQKTEGIQRA